MARKRRAISIKSGKCRTSARTPVNFTVLDATIISSAPTNTNTNYHTNISQLDFMNPHAVPAAANATIAQRGTCSGSSGFGSAYPSGAEPLPDTPSSPTSGVIQIDEMLDSRVTDDDQLEFILGRDTADDDQPEIASLTNRLERLSPSLSNEEINPARFSCSAEVFLGARDGRGS